jgi:hypothetical protein
MRFRILLQLSHPTSDSQSKSPHSALIHWARFATVLGPNKIVNLVDDTHHMSKAREGYYTQFFLVHYAVKRHDVIVSGFLCVFLSSLQLLFCCLKLQGRRLQLVQACR